MDFSGLTDNELLDLAQNAGGAYDGVRIYGNGALAELVSAAKQVWDPIRAEVERRGLGDVLGL